MKLLPQDSEFNCIDGMYFRSISRCSLGTTCFFTDKTRGRNENFDLNDIGYFSGILFYILEKNDRLRPNFRILNFHANKAYCPQ